MSSSGTQYFTSLPYKLLQRRWLILVPVVVSMSLAWAYTKKVKIYRSSAIVLFSTEYVLADQDREIARMFEEKVNVIVGSLLFGDSVRSIAQKVWPEVDFQADPVGFNSRVQRLASKGGIELSPRRDNDRALTIGFTSKDPHEAHRVVQATIETLVEESRVHTERRVASSTSFVKQEISEKRRELEKIEQEISRLQSGFGFSSEEGSARAVSSSGQNGVVATAASISENQLQETSQVYRSLPQLKFDLAIVEKEHERLTSRLQRGDFGQEVGDLDTIVVSADDEEIKDLRSTLAQKERDKNLLSSQGILERHPKRKSLDAEIRNLEGLLETRKRELAGLGGKDGSEVLKLKIERDLRTKIAQKAEEISTLKDKISVLQHYYDEVQQQKDTLVDQIDVISAQRARLEQLKQKRDVLAEAHRQAVIELEAISRRSRADEGDIGLRITVAEEPEVPKYPIPFAHLSTLFMTFALSFAAGIGMTCAIDGVDHSIQNLSELKSISPVPVIGEIDKMISHEQRTSKRNTNLGILAILALITLFADTIVDKLFL